MNDPVSQIEAQRILLRLIEYRSLERLCQILDSDPDTIMGLADADVPWSDDMIENVLKAWEPYKDPDDSNPNDGTFAPVGDADGDGNDSGTPTVDQDVDTAVGGARVVPSTALKTSVPAGNPTTSPTDALGQAIYAKVDRANEVLELDDASSYEELRALHADLHRLILRAMDVGQDTESDAAVLGYARLSADRTIRRIGDRLSWQNAKRMGWWQRFTHWLGN